MHSPLRLSAIAAVLGLVGCASPDPYYGGNAPVVDRSTIYPQPQALTQDPAQVAAVQPPPVEVTPLERPAPIVPERRIIPPPEPQPPAYAEPEPQPEAAPESPPAEPVKQGNQAVVALLDSAAGYVGNGQLDKAASSLERALQIEPRNAGIWHDLGQIRLHQQKFSQAEAMFSKSNGLAGQDRSLKARNWRMIAAARRAGGDSSGADAAEAQASTLEN